MSGYSDTVSFENFILGQVSERFGAPCGPEQVHWFHCTRVPPGTRFAEGILPLGAMLPQLEATLTSLVADPDHRPLVQQVFSTRGGHAFQFRLKTADSLHWGPYAILVRDVAFHARALGQHDYLGMPKLWQTCVRKSQPARASASPRTSRAPSCPSSSNSARRRRAPQ